MYRAKVCKSKRGWILEAIEAQEIRVADAWAEGQVGLYALRARKGSISEDEAYWVVATEGLEGLEGQKGWTKC